MGYDLHATRAADWKESSGFEIHAAEWRELVVSDPELEQDEGFGPHAVVWVDDSGRKRGWFDWYDGVVYTTDPDRATVEKLLQLAARLKARVQGDDGEFYQAIEDWESGRGAATG